MVNWKSKKLGDLLFLGNGLLFFVLLNLVSAIFFFRIDLTEEERYTIKAPTRQLLSSLEDVVYVEVFLEGDMNAEFRRLRNSIRETLEEFRIYSHNKVQYKFTNPALAVSPQARNEFVQDLVAKGIQMLPVVEMKDGERAEKIVFPGALVSYEGNETGVMLFKDNITQKSSGVLNQSIEGIEFQLASAILKLSSEARKKVAMVRGHGELDSLQVASLKVAMSEQYDVESLDLSAVTSIEGPDLLIIAKPRWRFSELDKYKLDQFLMRGGKLLFFLDQMNPSMDSASMTDYFAPMLETGLQDQLFKYGVRVNPDLVQDGVASKYPVVTAVVDNKPQVTPMDWPFFPLIYQYANHPVTRNLDAVLTRFVSSVDSVKATGIKKTPLLFSSPYSRKLSTPVKVGINDLRNVKQEDFNEGPVPVGYLLEGPFTSVFKNRFLPDGMDKATFKEVGEESKIVVIADGDFIRNDVNPRTGAPQQLGLDPISGRTFANQDLTLNIISYMIDDKGIITARNKEVVLRPLDKQRIKTDQTMWQFINLVLPIVLLVVFGIVHAYLRKRKYSNFE